MEVNNILVPVDFSKCSKNALKIAIKIAKKANAKIHIVNAVHVHAPHPSFMESTMIEGVMADYESQVKQSFEELESEIIELQDVPHDMDKFLSYLTDAIFSETKTKQIDLIVMGTRSDHDEVEHLIGTHATDIIETSEIPVLVIPENYDQFKLDRMGFASDFLKVVDYKKLEILVWFAKNFNAEVLVFHVTEDANSLTESEERQIEAIKKKLMEIDASIRTIEANSTMEGILTFIMKHDLDMLAMLPRKHGFFRRLFTTSVTKSLAINPSVPLLTFQEV